MTIDICIPVKNEEKIIKKNINLLLNFLESESILKAALKRNWCISIVINGSQDQSFNICKDLAKFNNGLMKCALISLPGKGRAIKEAWSHSSSDILVFMDADMAVSLSNLDKLISPILKGEADLVIGSRFMIGSILRRAWKRAIVSRMYIVLSRIILGHKFSDMQCGFKAISRSFYQKIQHLLIDDTWFFDTELIIFTNMYHGRIIEVPVNWQEPRSGQEKSKVKILKDGLYFITNLIKLQIRLKKLKKYLDNK